MSLSGPSAPKGPTKAIHFGLLDVPLSEVFSTATDPANHRQRSAPADDTIENNSSRGNVAAHRSSWLQDGARMQKRDSLAREQQPLASCQYKRPIRPKAISVMPSGDSGGISPRQRNAAATLGLEVSKLEGSATSDEHHETSQSRLIPRRGAGPDLRSEAGGKIDEYLMRLLRTGLAQADTTLSQQGPTHSRINAWQGSRLGPLAPGAGIKSSSLKAARPGPAPPANLLRDEDKSASEADKTDMQHNPSSALLPALEADSPPQTKQNGKETSVLVSHGREAITGAAVNRVRQDDSGLRSKSQSSSSGQTDLGNQWQALLGKHQWQQVHDRIRLQEQEFELQLKELHRLVDLQSRLHCCNGAATGPASADSHASWQHPSLNGQSFSGHRSDKQQAKNAWWLNSGAWDPSMAIGLATWQPPSSEVPDASHRKTYPPATDKPMSRTTKIALDAQRARRGKSRARSTSKARPKGQSSNGQGEQAERPAVLLHSRLVNPGSGQSQNTWLERLQPYSQQGACQSGGSKAELGANPQSIDPLINWYHYHFSQAAAQSNSADRHTPSTRAMQFAGLSLASPNVGWENQCQDYFNYSMTGTSDVNTAGHSSRHMAQRSHGLPRLAPPKSND